MQAVILAGGKGTRLAPYTKILPKPLMPICDMPILEVILHQMRHAGITEAFLTVGYLANLLESYFGDGSRFGLKLHYSCENCPLGTVGPLSLLNSLKDTFLVSNGDVLTTLDMADLIEYHRQSGGIATIAMHERQIKIDLGILQQDGGPEIVGYLEKPCIDYSVSMGLYVFEPRILNYIPKGQYLDFPNLVNNLLAAGEKVIGYPFKGYWQDLGNPADYQQAAQDFDRMQAEFLPGD